MCSYRTALGTLWKQYVFQARRGTKEARSLIIEVFCIMFHKEIQLPVAPTAAIEQYVAHVAHHH